MIRFCQDIFLLTISIMSSDLLILNINLKVLNAEFPIPNNSMLIKRMFGKVKRDKGQYLFKHEFYRYLLTFNSARDLEAIFVYELNDDKVLRDYEFEYSYGRMTNSKLYARDVMSANLDWIFDYDY